MISETYVEKQTSTVIHRGCALHYWVRGEGTPVLFIQGTGVHGNGWLPQVEELSTHYACLTFDNRGMGLSQPCEGTVTVEQMAEDTLAIMDHAGWESAHIVGHSLGGLIAQQLALAARHRVRSLALLCTFSKGADATRMTFPMFWLGMRTYIGSRKMRRRAFTRIILPPARMTGRERDALATKLAPLFGHDLADHPPVVSRQLGAMRAYDCTPRLVELEGMPTLIVSAGNDLLARPKVMKALAEAIPGSIHEEFPDDAHGLPIQRAWEVNAILKGHFDRADRSRAKGPREE